MPAGQHGDPVSAAIHEPTMSSGTARTAFDVNHPCSLPSAPPSGAPRADETDRDILRRTCLEGDRWRPSSASRRGSIRWSIGAATTRVPATSNSSGWARSGRPPPGSSAGSCRVRQPSAGYDLDLAVTAQALGLSYSKVVECLRQGVRAVHHVRRRPQAPTATPCAGCSPISPGATSPACPRRSSGS